MPDTSGSVDLSNASARTPEEEAALQALQNGETPSGEAEDDGKNPDAEEVLHTFLVVVDLNGNPRPIPVDHPQFKTLVQSTPDLMYAAAAVLVKDFTATEAAMATAGIMQQQAQAMQEQMLRQRLAQSGGLRA